MLTYLGSASSPWYRRPVPPGERRRRGPAKREIPVTIVERVTQMAQTNPWYGYKRIAVMCRREGAKVTNRQAYAVMKRYGLLHKPRPREAELYQAAKLWELLPRGPNDLWQTDVTYVHIPGYGWWYAITVIDYYSRYLLAAHLTDSYSAREAAEALRQARAEAERIHGPLAKKPFLVTDNGPSFIARWFRAQIRDLYAHVRIQYRTPQQLGLLERFHRTFKGEEVYWRLYDDPPHARECFGEFRGRYNGKRPHWALVPPGGGDPVTPADVYVRGVAVQIPRWQAWAKAAKEKLDEMLQRDAGRTAS